MTRIPAAILLILVLSSCAAERVSLEGLRPRAAELIDPRVPLPSEPVAGPVDASLASQAAAAVQRAREGTADFDALLPAARAAAAAAGSHGSESWVVAQEQLSALVGARAPVGIALGDLSALGAAQVRGIGDIAVADRKVLQEAAAEVAAIDAEQQQAIDALRTQIAR